MGRDCSSVTPITTWSNPSTWIPASSPSFPFISRTHPLTTMTSFPAMKTFSTLGLIPKVAQSILAFSWKFLQGLNSTQMLPILGTSYSRTRAGPLRVETASIVDPYPPQTSSSRWNEAKWNPPMPKLSESSWTCSYAMMLTGFAIPQKDPLNCWLPLTLGFRMKPSL